MSKKFALALILGTLCLAGCAKTAEVPANSVFPPKAESKLSADYLIGHSWLGSNINTGLLFESPDKVTSQVRAETDCQPTGTFQVADDKVQIEFTQCETENKSLTLTLGQDGENLLYTEFLIDQNGHKYYNTSSVYPAGTKKTVTLEGISYTIDTIASDPKLTDTVLLYQKPAADSPYYTYLKDDGSNDTKSLFSGDSRSMIGQYTIDGTTWYLVAPIPTIMGDLELKSADGKTILEKNLTSLPFTWINQKDISN